MDIKLDVFLDYHSQIKLEFDEEKDSELSEKFFISKVVDFESNTENLYHPLMGFTIEGVGKTDPNNIKLLLSNPNNPNQRILFNFDVINQKFISLCEPHNIQKLKNIIVPGGKKLSSSHLFGILDLEILDGNNQIINPINGMPYKTKICFHPTFISKEELKKFLQDFNESQNVLFDDESIFKQNITLFKNSNDKHEMRFLFYNKLWTLFLKTTRNFQYNRSISNSLKCRDVNYLSKNYAKIKRAKRVYCNNNGSIFSITDQIKEYTYNNSENYFVKSLLHSFHKVCCDQIVLLNENIEQIKISPHIKAYAGNLQRKNKYEQINDGYKNIKRQTYALYQSSPFNKIHKNSSSSIHFTNLLLLDLGYQKLLKIYNDLNKIGIINNSNKLDLLDNIRYFNDLYEQWCFLVLIKILKDDYRFKVQENLKYESYSKLITQAGLSPDPSIVLISPNNKYRIEIYRDKVYRDKNRSNDEYGVIYHPDESEISYCEYSVANQIIQKYSYQKLVSKIKNKSTPDISLEVFEINANKGIPDFIITIDPHLSVKKDYEKFAYHENIVSYRTFEMEGSSRYYKKLVLLSVDLFWGTNNTSEKEIDDSFDPSMVAVMMNPTRSETLSNFLNNQFSTNKELIKLL